MTDARQQSPAKPQSFSVLEVQLLIVLLPGIGRGVCLAGGLVAVLPSVPGCAPAPTAPDRSPFLQTGQFVLLRQGLAERAAVASS
jgi:hypothetical protein